MLKVPILIHDVNTFEVSPSCRDVVKKHTHLLSVVGMQEKEGGLQIVHITNQAMTLDIFHNIFPYIKWRESESVIHLFPFGAYQIKRFWGEFS